MALPNAEIALDVTPTVLDGVLAIALGLVIGKVYARASMRIEDYGTRSGLELPKQGRSGLDLDAQRTAVAKYVTGVDGMAAAEFGDVN